MRYRIFTEWRDANTTTLDDTGIVVDAPTRARALELATMRGACSGLGFRPAYVGLVAQQERAS